jgi:hypothetical protein
MMKTDSWPQAKRTWGDAAVDGLLSGVVAGLVMAAYVLVVGVAAGSSWETVLAQFDPGVNPAPLTGGLTHLAVAGVYGALFGLAWRAATRAWPRLPGLVAGLAFGVVLWLLAVVVTSSRPSGEWLRALPALHLALAHLLYGAVLGVVIQRLHR